MVKVWFMHWTGIKNCHYTFLIIKREFYTVAPTLYALIVRIELVCVCTSWRFNSFVLHDENDLS